MNPLIDTVGIEIEFANIPKAAADMLPRTSWVLVEDGSCRSRRNVYPGLPIEVEGVERANDGVGEYTLFGGEFVSPKINTNKKYWDTDIRKILEFLRRAGEGLDVRTSIHVHVNANGFPLFALKNLLKLGLHLEAGFFRIACGEMRVHRGALHLDYGYCRPISWKGPPVVRDSDGVLRPIFDTELLLEARSLKVFRQGLGRFDLHSGGKYHEARYVWLNLVSLYQLGSVEFRLFNPTYTYKYVTAWVDLCQHMVRTAFSPQIGELEPNPLGTNKISLERIISILGLDNYKTIYTLEALWNSAEYQRGVYGHQRGHLDHTCDWYKAPGYITPEPIGSTEVIYPFHEFSLGNNPTPIVDGWCVLPGV